MSYTLAQLNHAVEIQFHTGDNSYASYSDDSEPYNAWDAFYRALKNEVVRLDNIGIARLLDSDVDGKDYWNEGDIWFVFSVAADGGGFDKSYQRIGYYSSYEGRCFDSGTIQVQPKQHITTTWETV